MLCTLLERRFGDRFFTISKIKIRLHRGIIVKPQFLGLGLGLSIILSTASSALAVQPASISANANVAWSRVVDNPFDGRVVYDRNYKNDYVLVTSWSKSGIRATYTQIGTTLIGYSRPLYGFRLGFFPDREPVYQTSLIEAVPSSITIALNGKLYTYENGPVSPELATALANAKPGNVKIRLTWRDGVTRDTEIGRGTVEVWRTIFAS